MSGLQVNFNSPDPDLTDVLNLFRRDLLLNLNCIHVATIQSFNSSNQTATATINYNKSFQTLNQATGGYEITSINYPILMDCPTVCLGGGNGALTFPISKGDECLVLFNDRSIDDWFAGGGAGQVSSSRLHSFSDGIIIVGVRSLAHSLTNYDSSRTCLRGNSAGTTVVAVGSTLIEIGNITTTLGTILTDLNMALTTFNTALVAAGAAFALTPISEPSSAAGGAALASAATALSAAIVAVQTLITGLLQ